MARPIAIDRRRWLGHRWRGHALDGSALTTADLADLLLLGIPDARPGAARESLAQRLGGAAAVPRVGPDGPLVCWWSIRGAPHVHPIDVVDVVRRALTPRADDTAERVRVVTGAVRRVVTAPMTKGEVSRAVSEVVAPDLLARCERCAADHVPDGLFRTACGQAPVVLGPPRGRATVLYPPPPFPRAGRGDHRRTLLDAWFRRNGPIGRADLRDWLGTEPGSSRPSPGELVRVEIDGRRADLPEALIDDVRDAPAPRGVFLVPPGDPYLRQVDRTLLLPDRDRRGQVWRAVGAPGAVLIDGEIAGIWRARHGGTAVTVTPFAPLSRVRRAAVVDSAHRADARAEVAWD